MRRRSIDMMEIAPKAEPKPAAADDDIFGGLDLAPPKPSENAVLVTAQRTL